MRQSMISPLALLLAVLCAIVVTLVTAQITQSTKILDSIEHWSADWRTALLADRAATQHPIIAVVLIDDDTVAGLPYRSPIDRSLLARLIKTIDDAGARVIALDFLFDQPTEPDKDRLLIETIRKTSARMVLGSVDDRVNLRPEQRAYVSRFLAAAGAPTGFLNLKYELDGVVRGEAEPTATPQAGNASGDSFAAAIARAAGVAASPPAARIAWLKPPADGSDTFLMLPAGQLLARSSETERRLSQMLLSGLKDRVVLVGGDQSDHNDRHPTPISKLAGEPMSGVLIHAQSLAQQLDGRHLHRIEPWQERLLTFVMSCAGFLLGWRFRVNSWITVTIPVILLLLVGAFFLAGFRTIVPFAEPALGWAASAILGRIAMWLLGRQSYASYEAS